MQQEPPVRILHIQSGLARRKSTSTLLVCRRLPRKFRGTTAIACHTIYKSLAGLLPVSGFPALD